MEKAIRVEKLSFSYGKTTVFRNLDFSVDKESFTALIGSNGSGKSTLMKLLLGEIRAEEGTIEIFSTPVKEYKEWNKIGYVPQEGLTQKVDFPSNVLEIVISALYSQLGVFRFPGKREREKALKALSSVELEGFEHRLLSELSGGQRQRVLIARALVAEPKLLILDEPCTGMDEESLKSFYSLLKKLNESEGLTILMVSHDLDRISAYVSDIYCLEHGSVVYLTPSQLEGERKHTHVHPKEGCSHV